MWVINRHSPYYICIILVPLRVLEIRAILSKCNCFVNVNAKWVIDQLEETERVGECKRNCLRTEMKKIAKWVRG